MAFSPHTNCHPQILPKEDPTPIFQPVTNRTSSSSSDSSFQSSSFTYIEELSPKTPLKFKGIPFSWEQIPGIPKKHDSKNKEHSSTHLLPLPPAGNSNSSTKKMNGQDEISPKKYQQRDPFFAALVECSKDGGNDRDNLWKGSSKITRSLSDRFGFISMYTSCKTTCDVSQSLVYHPRSTQLSLLNRGSS